MPVSVDPRFHFSHSSNPYLARSAESPILVMDVDSVIRQYRELVEAFPVADIYYAMKANPEREILEALQAEGCSFDTASLAEIQQALSAGVAPERISFGNTIKKRHEIAEAARLGIPLYSVDSIAELHKVSETAPGSAVFVRILLPSNATADWPLSRKFGCDAAMAKDLLRQAPGLGLEPRGLSFHVGSQQTDATQWDTPISQAAGIYRELAQEGLFLKWLNLGGGFPAHYRRHVPDFSEYAREIQASLDRHFGRIQPKILLEPGRALVADAGVIYATVLLVSKKSERDEFRWVYLDIGKFGGLAETMDESIRYRITAVKSFHALEGEPMGPVILAGPTCDSADILYERHHYELPLSLKEGDLVLIHSAGAYTSTYASVGFNGIAPLPTVCI